MTAKTVFKAAAIVTGTVVVLSTLLAAGLMLFVAGATMGFIFLGIVIAAVFLACLYEWVGNQLNRLFRRQKEKPATR